MSFDLKNVLISAKAIERIEKDRFVQQNLQKYVSAIKALIELGRVYPTEKIGDFFVSPRGRTKIRVAWYQEGNFLIIYDLLYEAGKGNYVDKWNDKARKGGLTRKSYSEKKLRGISGVLGSI